MVTMTPPLNLSETHIKSELLSTKNFPDALTCYRKGKDKKGKGSSKDKPSSRGDKGASKGKGKDNKGTPATRKTLRNRDDDPSDNRTICPDFLTDCRCSEGGQCRPRHPRNMPLLGTKRDKPAPKPDPPRLPHVS
eukprot:335070-Amphidinium_carterae.1